MIIVPTVKTRLSVRHVSLATVLRCKEYLGIFLTAMITIRFIVTP